MEATSKTFRKRNAILTCLQGTDLHPSAEMVHEMLREEHPDISLATVYRNLTHFKNQGQITSVATVKGVERFDANTTPHVHFLCSNCDAVIDLYQMQIPQTLYDTAEGCCGGKIDDYQVAFSGTCRDCLKR